MQPELGVSGRSDKGQAHVGTGQANAWGGRPPAAAVGAARRGCLAGLPVGHAFKGRLQVSGTQGNLGQDGASGRAAGHNRGQGRAGLRRPGSARPAPYLLVLSHAPPSIPLLTMRGLRACASAAQAQAQASSRRAAGRRMAGGAVVSGLGLGGLVECFIMRCKSAG